MNLKNLKFEIFKHDYFIMIIVYLSLGCAGTVINPYLEDMYGKKKHIIKDVVVLLNVKEISDEYLNNSNKENKNLKEKTNLTIANVRRNIENFHFCFLFPC